MSPTPTVHEHTFTSIAPSHMHILAPTPPAFPPLLPPPVITQVGSNWVTVSWSELVCAGGHIIVSYTIRYIESSRYSYFRYISFSPGFRYAVNCLVPKPGLVRGGGLIWSHEVSLYRGCPAAEIPEAWKIFLPSFSVNSKSSHSTFMFCTVLALLSASM